MPTHSGKLTEPRGLFAALQRMMRRDNRLRELVHEAGGKYVMIQDSVEVSGLTDEQFATIMAQVDKEFPL